jgi:hypothetical protein
MIFISNSEAQQNEVGLNHNHSFVLYSKDNKQNPLKTFDLRPQVISI